MDKEIKERWTAALRSGEYKQGHGALGRRRAGGDTFCCLGVLAAITGIGQWENNYRFHVDNEGGRLPLEIAREFGLSLDEQRKLVQLNDNRCKPFPTIADWIDENL